LPTTRHRCNLLI